MTGASVALREAIDWHLRLADGDTDIWHAFTEWLEADKAHGDAYERVALDDRLLDDHRPARAPMSLAEISAPAPARRRLSAVWGAGIAAVLVGGIALHSRVAPAGPDFTIIEAPADSSRSVTLPDGTRIALHAGGRIKFDRAQPRLAMLEKGEALFEVHHDAAAPFRVAAAGRTIEDVGTVFDVAARGNGLRVAVAEGSVAYRAGDDHIVLTRGMAIDAIGDTAEMRHVDPAAVGAWRSGHVDFDDMRLADVAAQLHLSDDLAIGVAPSLAGQRFSGVIRSDRGAEEMVRSLALLSGTHAVHKGDGWMLETGAGR